MFDLAAYKSAIEARDVDPWLEFFVREATWTEYRPGNPPSAPNVLSGVGEIRAFLERVAPVPATLRVSREVVSEHRAAYTLTVTFVDGGQIVENVIIDLNDGGQVTRRSTSRSGTRV